MGRYGKPLTLMLTGAVVTALPFAARAEVLVYQNDNKWVAQGDNQPLQNLLKAAREGKTYYRVMLPTEERELGIIRLEIVKDLLAREAKAPVVMEEVGVAKSGTLGIE